MGKNAVLEPLLYFKVQLDTIILQIVNARFGLSHCSMIDLRSLDLLSNILATTKERVPNHDHMLKKVAITDTTDRHRGDNRGILAERFEIGLYFAVVHVSHPPGRRTPQTTAWRCPTVPGTVHSHFCTVFGVHGAIS